MSAKPERAKPRTRVWRAEIEFSLTDTGDLTAVVRSRIGSSGQCSPYQVEHDSHFLDYAVKVLGRTARRLRKEIELVKYAGGSDER